MRLLLYGGTFDPPHLGHMNNLRAAMDLVGPDRVIVMPAGIPPHKAASSTPGPNSAWPCARCFTALGPACGRQPSGRSDRGGTQLHGGNAGDAARRAYLGAELYLSVGSDMLLTFREWRNWRHILELATLVVESRQGGDAPALHRMADSLKGDGGRILFAHAPAFECASSTLRARLRAGDDSARKLLPPPVPELIDEYGLYK